MFSVQSVFKQDKCRVQLAVRQLPASKDVNREVEESAVLEAVTRQ
jgi:hypothetical protein